MTRAWLVLVKFGRPRTSIDRPTDLTLVLSTHISFRQSTSPHVNGLVRKGNSPVRRISRRHHDIHPRARTNTGCKLKVVTKMACGISPSRTKLTEDCDFCIWTKSNHSRKDLLFSHTGLGDRYYCCSRMMFSTPEACRALLRYAMLVVGFHYVSDCPQIHQAPTNGRT